MIERLASMKGMKRCRAMSGFALLAATLFAAGGAGVACDALPHDGVEVSGQDCASCHLDEYEATQAPVHAGAFPVTCGDCHEETTWRPARAIKHEWPLVGAHQHAPCAGCHVGDPPLYQGTSQLCVDCHLADFESSPFPGHSAFPKTCEQCHTPAGWTPASGGNHPEARFPIETGPHKVVRCLDCHNDSLGPTGKANADCVGCHTGEHSRSKMDAEHHEVSGYPAGAAPPNFCLDCHPSGTKEDD